jgi:hypothetical protein
MMAIKKYDSLADAIGINTTVMDALQAGTKIEKILRDKFPTAEYAVLFVNLDMNSSQFGKWTVLPIGPDQTFKTLAEVQDGHLNDLPSQRQYPVGYSDLKGATA